MARKRTRHTLDLIEEALERTGQRTSVPVERIRERLGLPEVDGHFEDADMLRAVRELRAEASFAKDGAAAVRRAIPELASSGRADGGLDWFLRVHLPLAEGGRLDLRLKVQASQRMVAVLDRMSSRNDASHGLQSLREACADHADLTRKDMRRILDALRADVSADLRGLGADAPSYVDHLAQALRSQEVSPGSTPAASIPERLRGLRNRARAAAGEDSRMRRLRDSAGFGAYIDKFAAARALNRRIVFHMGPTNSGKTYAALQKLRAAPTGAYLAPLRLLALENYETLRDMGLRAGMVTGEEVLGERDCTHVSRTIETADLSRPIDVAVIDEIQMLSDPDRGWAWTNALFGIPAREVVVCGSDDALPYLRRAAEAAGESIEVVEFQRKTPLVLVEKAMALEDVEAGDAVVAFSRRMVHEQREILIDLGHSVATIYGALSPEVRRAEATRFRDGEADVLVTTDAIGMGLNLGPLKRVVFSAVRKWDGKRDRPLSNPELRQIAGRAGRFGHQEIGYVAVLGEDAVEPVREALSGAPALPPEDGRFYVRPDIQAIRAAAEELGTRRLGDVLAHFARATFYEGSPFQPCALEETVEAARVVDRADLPIEERFAFSVCPIDRRDDVSVAILERWAMMRARGEPVAALRAPHHGDLMDQERGVRLASAYLWLSRRFPETFDDVEATRDMRARANEAIEEHLRATATKRARRRNAGRAYGSGTGRVTP
jgi:ATP-dependent RNA helicase SUPV3L1/SUV3